MCPSIRPFPVSGRYHEADNHNRQPFDTRSTTATGSRMGDDGHKAVALIAQHYLTPTAKRQIDAMLAADTDPLTKHDIASEATWADKYRDSNHRKDHYEETKR